MRSHGNRSTTTRHPRQMLHFGLLLLWCCIQSHAAAAVDTTPQEECGPLFLGQTLDPPPHPLPPSTTSVWVGVRPPQITWGNLTLEFESQGSTLRLNLSCHTSPSQASKEPMKNVHLRMASLELFHRERHGRRGPSGLHVHLLDTWPVLLTASAWNNFSLSLHEGEVTLNLSSSPSDKQASFSVRRVSTQTEDLDTFSSAVVRCTRPCGVNVDLPCSAPGTEQPAASMSTPASATTYPPLSVVAGPIAAMIMGILVILTFCLGLAWCHGRSKLAAERKRHQERVSRVRYSSSCVDVHPGGCDGGTENTQPSYIALEASDVSISNGFDNDAYRNSVLQLS